jgi:hypothetical protein
VKALLINPWVYDFACYDLFNKPLGLLEIAALLKDNNVEVEFIDSMDRFHPDLTQFLGAKAVKFQKTPCGNYYSEEARKPAIFKDIPRKYKRHGMPEALFRELLRRASRPDIIIVTSGMTYWYEGVFEAIHIVKEIFPHAPVILGGIYATLCHGHAVKNSGADSVFKGTSIKGAAKLISEASGWNLDAAGHYPPAYELYPELKYITLRTSNGCPYRCSYCAWHLLDPVFHQDDPEDVLSGIEGYRNSPGVKRFAFYDEALFYNAEGHIIPILKGILKRGIQADFYTPNGLHARFVTEELAGLLKKCNFIEPRLGFESSDISRQRSTGGKVDNEALAAAIMRLKSAGYSKHEIGVNILIGLPDQRYDEVEKSLKFVNSFGVKIHLEEYSPVPGTAYYKKAALKANADPLIQNNSVFPLYDPECFAEFKELKDLNQKLNKEIKYSIISNI